MLLPYYFPGNGCHCPIIFAVIGAIALLFAKWRTCSQVGAKGLILKKYKLMIIENIPRTSYEKEETRQETRQIFINFKILKKAVFRL